MAARKKQPNALVEIEREIGLKGSLHDFVKIAWDIVEPSQTFFDSWHIGAMCEHYQAIEEGQISKLVVNIPPGCSKSRIAGVFWPVWAWLRDAGLRWGLYSFDGDNTLKSNRDSLAFIQSDWFQERFGHLFNIPARDPAEGNYFNNKGGWRFANSVGGVAMGKHFHRQVIDDPLKPKAISPVILASTKAWLTGTMNTRWIRGDRHTARALVMQRLHEDDTTAQMLAEGTDVVHLMLPMEFEPARKCVTKIGFQDPRTEAGELLCPKFMTPEVVKELKKTMTEQEIASQLQQSPTAAGGNIFKNADFRYWIKEGAPTDRFEQQVPPRGYKPLPTKFDMMWQSWDFTFKDTKTSDFVVGQVWGRLGADFFLLWQMRDRMDFTTSVQAIKNMSALFPKARKKLVEDKANGTAIMNALKGRMFGIEAVEPEGGKEARASACSPLVQSGNVYFPDPDMPGFEWVRPTISEHCSFPFAKNDDTVDATSQALNWGSNGFKAFQAAMERLQGTNPQAAAMRALVSRFGR